MTREIVEVLIDCFIVRILLWIGFNMAGICTVNLCCFVLQIVQKTLVLCRLKTNRVWFSPTINNGKLPKQLSNQETWPMNMDVDDSSTDTGFHLNGPPNIMGWVGQLLTILPLILKIIN